MLAALWKTEKNLKISFGPNNILYFQDFAFWEGIPEDIIFDVELKRLDIDYEILDDAIHLVADGYGRKGNYGNGALIVRLQNIFKFVPEEEIWYDDWF